MVSLTGSRRSRIETNGPGCGLCGFDIAPDNVELVSCEVELSPQLIELERLPIVETHERQAKQECPQVLRNALASLSSSVAVTGTSDPPQWTRHDESRHQYVQTHHGTARDWTGQVEVVHCDLPPVSHGRRRLICPRNASSRGFRDLSGCSARAVGDCSIREGRGLEGAEGK